MTPVLEGQLSQTWPFPVKKGSNGFYLGLHKYVFSAFSIKTAFSSKRQLFCTEALFALPCFRWYVKVLKRRLFPTKRRLSPTKRRLLPTASLVTFVKTSKRNGVFDGKQLKFVLFRQAAEKTHPWKVQVYIYIYINWLFSICS